MSKTIFGDLRPPRAPHTLKQMVLIACKEALAEPVQAENAARTNWADRCLQATAGIAVFVFVLTCFASFVTDNTLIASARFSRLDVKKATVPIKTRNNSSFIVQRKQLWP